jgi:hypothetical protein
MYLGFGGHLVVRVSDEAESGALPQSRCSPFPAASASFWNSLILWASRKLHKTRNLHVLPNALPPGERPSAKLSPQGSG